MTRLMRMFIPITFPYLTFLGFQEEAKKETEVKKDGTIGGKTQFLGQ